MHHYLGVSVSFFTSARSSGNETANVIKYNLRVYDVCPRNAHRGADVISKRC